MPGDEQALAKGAKGEMMDDTKKKHCQELLKNPPACQGDTKNARAYVMCSAWAEKETRNLPKLQIKEAWARFREKCHRSQA